MNEGQYLMQLGQDRVEVNNKEWMDRMRFCAMVWSAKFGQVSTDDLHQFTETIGQPTHPNAWGAIFRNNKKNSEWRWEFVRTIKSVRKEAHARRISVWTYKLGNT